MVFYRLFLDPSADDSRICDSLLSCSLVPRLLNLIFSTTQEDRAIINPDKVADVSV